MTCRELAGSGLRGGRLEGEEVSCPMKITWSFLKSGVPFSAVPISRISAVRGLYQVPKYEKLSHLLLPVASF